MKALVRWRLEGEMVVDTNNLEAGMDRCFEVINEISDPNSVNKLNGVDNFRAEQPEILDAKIVGP